MEPEFVFIWLRDEWLAISLLTYPVSPPPSPPTHVYPWLKVESKYIGVGNR